MHADPESKRNALDPRRAKHRRRALTAHGSLTKLVAIGLNQVEDASSEYPAAAQGRTVRQSISSTFLRRQGLASVTPETGFP